MLFAVRMVEHGNRLPSEAVDSVSVEILETHLDTVLGNLLWLTLLEQGDSTRGSQEVPSNLSNSVMLYCKWRYVCD